MSVKTYDFIIGYENKVRELESVCLLKYELEKRGYSVLIFQEFDQRYDDVYTHLYHAKVLILSCGYEDHFVEAFCRRFITFDKLVNWQWEQIFNDELEDDPDSYLNVHGEICRQAVQLSWGEYNVDRLVRIMNIPRDRVYKTGNISMDFLRPEFNSFYKTREEVLAEYGINPQYKVAILIGVFQDAFTSEEELTKRKEETGYDYHDIARENRMRFDIEMDWIYRALQEDSNLFFIYRPHPGEEIDRCPEDVRQLVENIKSKTGRFIVNQDYTVRQWFKVADKVYTGYSTTMVDAYYAKVACRLLAPAGIPMSEEVRLFDGIKETQTYEAFKESLSEDGFVSPLKEEHIDGYFGVTDKPSYIRIIEALEQVLSDDKYVIDTTKMLDKLNKQIEKDMSERSLGKRIKLRLWRYNWFYNMYWCLMSLPIKHSYFERQKEYKERIEQYKRGYIAQAGEVRNITGKIKRCIG